MELDIELFSQHREAFPKDVFTLDAFLWAVATVRSRVHSPLDGDYVALVPLADLVRKLLPSKCRLVFFRTCILPRCPSELRKCRDSQDHSRDLALLPYLKVRSGDEANHLKSAGIVKTIVFQNNCIIRSRPQ